MASSYHRKLLKTDSKPKLVAGRTAAPLNSASSSSTTTMPPPEKRTRDLPNFSDCHCCGRHVNHMNPKDRLQPMDSIWRIVLLCRKCRRKFSSGQTCSYCFKETVSFGDFFKCSVCQRKIHKDCVKDYKNSAPWCYLGIDLGFRVCVDCWVPDSLKNSIGRDENKGAFRHKGDAKDCSEKIASNAKSDAVVKLKMAGKGREQAFTKVAGVKNSVNCEDNFYIEPIKQKNGQMGGISESSGEIKVSEDEDLAFRLHRAINSSPRILKGKCLVDSYSDYVKNGDSYGFSYSKSSIGETQSETLSAKGREYGRNCYEGNNSLCSDAYEPFLEPITYKRDRNRKAWLIADQNAVDTEYRSSHLNQVQFMLHLGGDSAGSPSKWDHDIVEIVVCVNSDQVNSCINADRFGQHLLVYKRTKLDPKVCQENCMASCSQRTSSILQNHKVNRIKQEFSLVDSDAANFFRNGGCNTGRDCHLQKYSPTDCVGECNNKEIFPNKSSDADLYRYSVKYGKRVVGAKYGRNDTFLSVNDSGRPCLNNSGVILSSLCGSLFVQPLGTSNEESDRYLFKYRRRVKGSL